VRGVARSVEAGGVNWAMRDIERAFGLPVSVAQQHRRRPEEELSEILKRLRDASQSKQESEGTTLKVVFDSRQGSRGLLSDEAIERLSA